MTTTVPAPETDFALPTGFNWAGVPGGIKYRDRRDVGFCVAQDGACPTAAVFTQNGFAAAPVLVSRELLQQSGGHAAGVIVNSGCANAATGAEGMKNAREMADQSAAATGQPGPFMVCSTGTIGVQLPMDRLSPAIENAAKAACSSTRCFMDFATSILTTDTRHKIASARVQVGGKEFRILGCAKGSGMMQPKMATMLAYVFTDAQVAPDHLQRTLSDAVEHSLNCVTVDGDTSTNDTTILMASGASGVEVASGETLELFNTHLLQVLQSLSKQLARDGEGASKLIEVEVHGAADFLQARAAALTIANSPLVKTAIYGRDANWGRIAMALGNTGLQFKVEDVTIKLGHLVLFRKGAPLPLDEAAALEVLNEEFIRIEVEMGAAPGKATVWTCDLTEKYIEINGSYRT